MRYTETVSYTHLTLPTILLTQGVSSAASDVYKRQNILNKKNV